MIESSSSEDDGAVVGPLTFGFAMIERQIETMTVGEELYVDRINKWFLQSMTLKSQDIFFFNASSTF